MLLVLDDYHLGDPLFLTGLAQDIAAARRPALLLHTGREAAASALEAAGELDPDAALAAPAGEHAALIERAVRDEGRTIAAALTEAGVAVVRMLASARGLVRGTEAAGPPELGPTAWIETLLRQRSCVVMAAAVERDGGGILLDPAALTAALAEALGLPVVVLTTSRAPGLLVNGRVSEIVATGALVDRAEVPAAELAADVARRGARVVVTSRGGAFDPDGARGTYVEPAGAGPRSD